MWAAIALLDFLLVWNGIKKEGTWGQVGQDAHSTWS